MTWLRYREIEAQAKQVRAQQSWAWVVKTGYFRPPYHVNSNLTGHYTGGRIAYWLTLRLRHTHSPLNRVLVNSHPCLQHCWHVQKGQPLDQVIKTGTKNISFEADPTPHWLNFSFDSETPSCLIHCWCVPTHHATETKK